jgi:hypothetical protein
LSRASFARFRIYIPQFATEELLPRHRLPYWMRQLP